MTNSILKKTRLHQAFIMGELIVALTVLGTLVTCLALSLNGVKRFNHYHWKRQCCIAAAQAQLDSVTFTGHPLDPCEVNRLWPRVKTTVMQTPGESDWEGLTLVTVRAEAASFQRHVETTLARYLDKPARMEVSHE